MAFVRIQKAEALAGHRLRLTLTTGEVVERDVEQYLVGPVFEEIRTNPALFAQVRVEHGTVVWPGEVDLCPDVLICGGAPEELVACFAGVSISPGTIAGIWVHDGSRFEDALVRWVVDVEDLPENRQFFADRKPTLLQRFKQVEIYSVNDVVDVGLTPPPDRACSWGFPSPNRRDLWFSCVDQPATACLSHLVVAPISNQDSASREKNPCRVRAASSA